MAWPASAEAPEDLYRSALERIDTMYLWRDELELPDVLEQVGRQIASDLEWAMAETDGDRLTLSHGDGRLIGSVQVEDWSELHQGLVDLEALIRGAGEPLDGAPDVDIILLRGVSDALDRHSRVLYGEKLKSFDKRLKGTLSGIGARIGLSGSAVLITEVYPGYPAADGGLAPGDRLLRIDEHSTVGMTVSDAVEYITGPRGSVVELEVERDTGEGPVVLEVSLVREEIRLPNVSWRPLREGVGYVAIDHFSEQTVSNLEAALAGLSEAGALERGLVLDLRGNTGGSMIQSARVADAFLELGTLVRTEGRDGGPVSGLVSKIKAQDSGREPQVPLVILQDGRTASGSEIVAGALRELDRAVLIGTRSYGKGTVQKVYTLGPGARLKLTVAQYLLPGGLSIRDIGLSPDLEVGKLSFDYNGVWRSTRLESADPLLFVDRRTGWKTGAAAEDRGDLLEELAVRVLLDTKGVDRAAGLEALERVSARVRAEEEALLMETFSERIVDWSPAPSDGEMPDVEVQIAPVASQVSGEKTRLVARVKNLGDETLHRVVLRLDSSDSAWRDRIFAVGKLAPGETREAELSFTIGAGRYAREAEVDIQVEADRCPPVRVTPTTLAYKSDPPPTVDLELSMVPKGEAWEARVALENEGEHALYGLRVRFEYPESAKVELTRYDAGLSVLDAGAREELALGLRLLDDAEAVPLVVHVKADGYGEILEWPLELPRSGAPVALSAPRIDAPGIPTSAPAGELDLALQLRDDRAVDHVVVWADGEKIAYRSGAALQQPLHLPVAVEPGENRYAVYATDDQGLTRRAVWYVRGLPPITTDATP